VATPMPGTASKTQANESTRRRSMSDPSLAVRDSAAGSAFLPFHGVRAVSWPLQGDVAQLVEHLLCKQGVVGSSPIVSTALIPAR
jgi:hypothetical protein